MLALLLTLALGAQAAPLQARKGTALSVPYLPQTEALCGGAAAAMVFRYWGDRHADVQQFAALVDRKRGGIVDTVLVDALRTRGWNAVRLEGSVATIREQVLAGRPLILLIEDRPGFYHYVVAVDADDTSVVLHDPTWGPSRRWPIAELLRVWAPSKFWTLLVTPGEDVTSVSSRSLPTISSPPPAVPPTTCDRLLNDALDVIAGQGLSAADDALGRVRQQCPAESAPIRELAGVRFAERRWRDASVLAEEAIRLDPGDGYTWNVLGSSRFLQDDILGALRAWNRIGRPQLDSVEIGGLTRTRHALVADVLHLQPNTLLKARQFALAGRRLDELPDQLASRISYRPEPDGFATVDVRIVERSRRPQNIVEWGTLAAQTAINRELAIITPGGTGQGEVWNASWRWWQHRPRVAAGFSAPRTGRLPGIWRVDGAWEAQTYRVGGLETDVREERTSGTVSVTDWLIPSLRYELGAGLDSWNDSRRAVSLRAGLEHRLFGDRIALAGDATHWAAIDDATDFDAASIEGRFLSSREARGLVVQAKATMTMASDAAPLALWSGAGEGRGRPGLLRAHQLLRDGIIDGPIFGRRTRTLNVEAVRWLTRPVPIRIGIAGFTDAADARDRLPSASGKAFLIDAGVGLRLRVPGREDSVRLDFARGLRDGRQAVSIGWTVGASR